MSKETNNEFLRHENYVIKDCDGSLYIWSKKKYETYIRKCVSIGTCPTVLIVSGFNSNETYLSPIAVPLSEKREESTLTQVQVDYYEDKIERLVNSGNIKDEKLSEIQRLSKELFEFIEPNGKPVDGFVFRERALALKEFINLI